MQKITRIAGIGAALLKANIDTDVIIPAKRLVGYQREQLGVFLFEPLRFRADRAENPDFVLNQPRYRDASILVTGENFGCGSSRESAVWALMAYGIHCIIAPGFGDIFENNAFQNGLLLIRLPKEQTERIAAEFENVGTPMMAADLEKQVVTMPSGETLPFLIDAERREALLNGRDEIAMTLARDSEIDAYQARDRVTRPWIYQTAPTQGAV